VSRLLVYVGPTLTASEVRRAAPGAEILPPVEGGMLGRARPRAGDVIVMIDGYYRDRPSVRHKEIMYLMDQGVIVVGGASMGALRAAELDELGMIGVGQVYQMYKTGEICGDDEVAVRHRTADHEYQPDSIALVNLRFGGQRAADEGVVSPQAAAGAVAAAKELTFDERTWPRITAAARDRLSAACLAELPELARYCAGRPCDLKARDAVLAIEHGRRLLDGARPRAAGQAAGGRKPPWHTAYLRNWVSYWEEAEFSEAGDPVSDSDILDAARLYSPSYPDIHQDVLSRLLAEVAAAAEPARPSVPRYAMDVLGLDDGDPLPGRMGVLLSAPERQLPTAEQAALVMLRCWPTNLCREWRTAVIARLKSGPDWAHCHDLVLAADAARNSRPGELDASIAGLMILHRWGASGPAVPRELGRRGFVTLAGLDLAAARFAALELNRRPGAASAAAVLSTGAST
jgi:hypothetical protein